MMGIMKRNLMFVAAILLFVINAGCINTASIKIPISAYPDIANCIIDADSHGQCGGTVKDNSFKRSVVPVGDSASYFEVLDEIVIREKINVSKFKSIPKDGMSPEIMEYYDCFIKRFNDTKGVENINEELSKSAQTMLLSETNRSIRDLFDRQSSTDDISRGAKKIEFDATDTSIFVGDLVNANNYGGLAGFEKATADDGLRRIMELTKAGERLDKETDERLQRRMEIVEDIFYTREYLKAYFRQWKLINVEINASDLMEKIKNKILDEVPFLVGEQFDEYVNELFEKLTGKTYQEACVNKKDECMITIAGKIETSQFVNRAGDQYGFPSVTVTLDPLADQKFNITTIDWTKIGADIVRVYIEAVGDRMMGLPAVPGSTLCELKNELCYPLKNDISTQDFYAVSELANQTEAHVSTAVGQLTRGVWWTSLNNEALASIIETSAGAVAKKCAEKFGYCVYSCSDMHKKNRDSTMAETTLREIKVKVTY